MLECFESVSLNSAVSESRCDHRRRAITTAAAGGLILLQQEPKISAHQPRDDLDMLRIAELIDRGDRGEAIAAIDEDAHIAGKASAIA